jgi:hypothetical protein
MNEWRELGTPSGGANGRIWVKLLDALVNAGVITKSTAIDSTYIKAQRAAFGGKGGASSGRSVAREAAGQPRSMGSPMSSAAPMR